MTGYVGKIETLGLVDGPGIRTVVFLEGCPLRCIYCHNPEMWTITKKQAYTPSEMVDILLKYKSYYDSSKGGVTFSGGEPLYQEDFLLELLKLCKENKIHTTLDTSGFYLTEAKLEQILKLVDLVILDIKHVNDTKYQEITGLKIDKVNEFIDICNNLKKEMWLRTVIVPGINDNEDYIADFKKYIKKIKNIRKIELLPYHTLGKSKYEALNIPYTLNGIKDLSSDILNELNIKLNQED